MSDCSVCLTVDESVVCDVFRQQNVRARKPHRCCECGRLIAKGELHQLCNMLCEGEWSAERTCLVCAEIRKAFYCHGEMIGEFWSQMEDYAFPEITQGSDCLKKLTTVEAKRYFAKRYRDWKEARTA